MHRLWGNSSWHFGVLTDPKFALDLGQEIQQERGQINVPRDINSPLPEPVYTM